MKESVFTAVRQILTDYLDENNLRKTPERYTLLEAVYSFGGSFSVQDMDDYLEAHNFHVSKATLYNTLNLFMRMRLVVCHRLDSGKRFEANYANSSHSMQICTVCGKTSVVKSPEIEETIQTVHLRRFRREGFSLYIYGTCSSCQAKLTREKNKRTKKQIKENAKR
ncbi:MAG: transcriptional repressor [Prevotella sp.]|nr:transcriptional repressor [Prevotella sp.]